MLNLDIGFFAATGMTLMFALITAVVYHRKFLKNDIAVAIVIYSFFIFCIVYFVSFESNIGLGIGLLGILSLIRLRSTPENLIDIGYILYAITLGLLNASVKDLQSVFIIDLLLTLAILIIASRYVFRRRLVRTTIVFDEIDLKIINDKNLLNKKIKELYGIDPIESRIQKLDYLKEAVTLDVSYDTNGG